MDKIITSCVGFIISSCSTCTEKKRNIFWMSFFLPLSYTLKACISQSSFHTPNCKPRDDLHCDQFRRLWIGCWVILWLFLWRRGLLENCMWADRQSIEADRLIIFDDGITIKMSKCPYSAIRLIMFHRDLGLPEFRVLLCSTYKGSRKSLQ